MEKAEHVTVFPRGTVTLLFTDIVGSTRALDEVGPTVYRGILEDQRRIIRSACARYGGVEVDTQGDALFMVFDRANAAAAAALEAQAELEALRIAVRMGIHTGEPDVTENGYVGMDVHRAARICAVAHGGQIVMSATTARLISGADVRDLGEHRLKDLGDPIRLFQLDAGEHPPLRTLGSTNLPTQATPIVGRQREVEEAAALLRSTRLLTLTGPGGVGKTRLAVQLATEVADAFPDGVRWLPLQAISDHQLVLGVIAQDLGIVGPLEHGIADRRLLLVLDNFEHLLQAASDLADLCARTEHLTMIVTSREPLHIEPEQVYRVTPLASEAAVELFASRARRMDPTFTEDANVGAICARLDRLPLAIELAAARVAFYGTAELLTRLARRLPVLASARRDIPERQRTLRSAIAWSYELLSPEEQTIFRRLSIFAGSFSLPGAQAVVSAEPELIQSLLDRSLLAHVETKLDEPRFGMLATVREYADELMTPAERAEIEQPYTNYTLELVEGIVAAEDDPGSDVVNAIEADLGNIRVLLQRAHETKDLQTLARAVAALGGFWFDAGYFREAPASIEPVYERRAEVAARTRIGVLRAAAKFAHLSDSLPPEQEVAEELVETARQVGDRKAVADALRYLASLHSDKSDRQRGAALATESQAIYRELGDLVSLASITNNVAVEAWTYGEYARAERLAVEVLDAARAARHRVLEALGLENQGIALLLQQRPHDAAPVLREALALHVQLGMRREWPILVEAIAAMRLVSGRTVEAGRLFGAADAMRAATGYRMDPADMVVHEHVVAALRAAMSASQLESLIAEGRELTAEAAVSAALERDIEEGKPTAESPGLP